MLSLFKGCNNIDHLDNFSGVVLVTCLLSSSATV